MEYRTGSVNRIFVVRFDDGDDFFDELNRLIIREKIENGWFQIIGGLRAVDMVTGPKEPSMPPEPVWRQMEGAYETVGSGSVYRDENGEAKIHLHAALGHHGETITGCLRKNSKVYLVLELLLMELSGFTAGRPWFPAGGFNRLTFD